MYKLFFSPFCVIGYVDLYFNEDQSDIAMYVIINDIFKTVGRGWRDEGSSRCRTFTYNWKFLKVIIYILVFNKGFDKEKVTNVTMKEGIGGSHKSICFAECKLKSKL